MFQIWILDHDLHTVVELAGGCSTHEINEGSDGNIPAKTEIVARIGALATYRFAYEHEN